MHRVFIGFIFGAAMMTLAGCASTNSRGEVFDAGIASSRLQTSMTEEQVINATGWRPDSVQMMTCGGNSPWQCKVLEFGTQANNKLSVYMIPISPTDSIVNSWRVMKF